MKRYSRQTKAIGRSHALGALSTLGVMAVLSTPHAIAADPPAVSAPAVPILKTITVTAEHIRENSQRVPISITNVSATQLQSQGAVSINTISTAVPQITVAGKFWSNMYIRGVGTNSASPNNEPSVATYIDGVYDPSPYALSALQFNNITQITVLKGPQGTLFGRDTTGGVVQIRTATPRHHFGGHASLGYANYDTASGNVYLTGGVSRNVAADLAVTYENQGRGWGYDPPFHRRINWHHNFAARSRWLYTPSESTKVIASIHYTSFTSDGSNNQMLPGSVAPKDPSVGFPGKFNCLCVPNVADSQDYGGSLTVDQLFDGLRAVSISSYRNVLGHWFTDSSNTPYPYQLTANFNDSDYVTQELRLNNENPGRVRWQVGAFFFAANVHLDPQASFGTKEKIPYSAAFGNQTTRSTSAFGQTTIEVVRRTHLTLGLRYTDETLHAYGDKRDAQGGILAGPFYDTVNYKPWTWRVALDHQFMANVLGYVSYDHGFASGGFNLSSPGSAPFFPENLDAYEMGLKNEFDHQRMRLNLATFYYEYRNLQVAIVPGGGSQIFTNAAKARNYGVDANFDFAATEYLTLSASASWLDAKYLDYPDARGYTILGKPIALANARGKELPFSPPYAGSVSANYRMPTAVGLFESTLGVSYQDAYGVSPTEQPKSPADFLVNASVEWWTNSNRAFGVRVWGRNLNDAYYPANLISSANGWYGTYAAPRTYGLTLMKDF